jgi:hypothetical protein
MADEQSDAEAIRNQLAAMSREPFLRELSVLLGQAPDPEKIKEFANKCPDRWSQAVAIFARAAGFSDKHEIDTGLAGRVAQIQQMSDSELLARLAELQGKPRPSLKPAPTRKRLEPAPKREPRDTG